MGEMASKREGAERDRESNKWLFESFCSESQRQKGENKMENEEKEEQNIQRWREMQHENEEKKDGGVKTGTIRKKILLT